MDNTTQQEREANITALFKWKPPTFSPSKSPSKASSAGKLLSIELTNFQCHAHLRMELHGRVNVLIGPDVEAKRAILAGLVAGLDCYADPSNMTRYIMPGQSEATVVIKIFNGNCPEEAYMWPIFSHIITLVRTFNAAGDCPYMLYNANGEMVSNLSADLESILSHHNIQVASPVLVYDPEERNPFRGVEYLSWTYSVFARSTKIDHYATELTDFVDVREPMRRQMTAIDDALPNEAGQDVCSGPDHRYLERIHMLLEKSDMGIMEPMRATIESLLNNKRVRLLNAYMCLLNHILHAETENKAIEIGVQKLRRAAAKKRLCFRPSIGIDHQVLAKQDAADFVSFLRLASGHSQPTLEPFFLIVGKKIEDAYKTELPIELQFCYPYDNFVEGAEAVQMENFEKERRKWLLFKTKMIRTAIFKQHSIQSLGSASQTQQSDKELATLIRQAERMIDEHLGSHTPEEQAALKRSVVLAEDVHNERCAFGSDVTNDGQWDYWLRLRSRLTEFAEAALTDLANRMNIDVSFHADHAAEELFIDFTRRNAGQADNSPGVSDKLQNILYLMGMWTCVPLAFYFLEEYDALMSQDERDLVSQMIQEEAAKHPERQYLILMSTPMDESASNYDYIRIHNIAPIGEDE